MIPRRGRCVAIGGRPSSRVHITLQTRVIVRVNIPTGKPQSSNSIPDFREFQGYLVAGELNGLQTQRVHRQTVSVCKQINGRLCFPRVAALKICSPTPR